MISFLTLRKSGSTKRQLILCMKFRREHGCTLYLPKIPTGTWATAKPDQEDFYSELRISFFPKLEQLPDKAQKPRRWWIIEMTISW